MAPPRRRAHHGIFAQLALVRFRRTSEPEVAQPPALVARVRAARAERAPRK